MNADQGSAASSSYRFGRFFQVHWPAPGRSLLDNAAQEDLGMGRRFRLKVHVRLWVYLGGCQY